jgi:hypothetical protein
MVRGSSLLTASSVPNSLKAAIRAGGRRVKRANQQQRIQSDMSPATRELLLETLDKDIEYVEKRTGRRLDHWRAIP